VIDVSPAIDTNGAVIAIDIGGTTIKGAAVNRAGRVIARQTTSSFAVDDDVLSGVVSVIHNLRTAATSSGFQVRRIGLASPGLVDAESGTVHYAPNLRWKSLRLKDLLEDGFNLPVRVEHDARTGAMAERSAHPSQSRRFDDFVFIPLGTGVSAAIVTAGVLVAGATGASGEFGHVSVDPRGELCVCGRNGCVEAYASASSIVARYRRLGGVLPPSAPAIAGAITSDPIAARVWDDAVDALARGISSLTAVLDPAVIVIGVGLSDAGPILLEPLRVRVSENLSWRTAPDIIQSKAGPRAGLVGAALLAWTGTPLESNFVEAACVSLRGDDAAVASTSPR